MNGICKHSRLTRCAAIHSVLPIPLADVTNGYFYRNVKKNSGEFFYKTIAILDDCGRKHLQEQKAANFSMEFDRNYKNGCA